ncbi:carbohydrate ABC transporter permease [Paractinoplanes ferrugineus]|uniref:Sugar ABC transporter permease n=1 Tax=Paractinoplanes ferrugineus TaxID=113564 RepID=A0A919IVY7_9ACTN|nr:carbohydrate ABC transporter permease [Actinoplanes ferrugineus]GIE08293.1 sugar ABC transporter permease [Actinoplanes ferrugineus]
MTAVLELPAPPIVEVNHKAKRQNRLAWIARHSIAIVLVIMFLTPVVYLVLLSLMTSKQALTSNYWPDTWHFENYVNVFRSTPLPRYLLNTVSYAVSVTLLTLLSSVPAAYALAKLKFRGQNALFLTIICVMMLPPQVVTVPLYLMWARYGLTGSLAPLIVPALFGDAFTIFLLRQFLLTIPTEYLDAARVDGCGEWRTLLRVVLPMARPGIAAAGLFQFFFCWNDYYGPLLYTSENEHSWTLTLGLASFRTVHHVDWNLVTAATVLAMAPLIIIFFFAQRAFVQGITLTGQK